jgi:regulator of sigma E protease
MAIISAGVIMNLIFAFVLAVVAYSIGVRQIPCIVGEVFPGEPAWQADLRTGDEILSINGRRMREFRDLQAAISLGDIDKVKGVPFEIRRPGVEKPFTVMVKPDRARGAYTIGVFNVKTPQLSRDEKTWLVLERNAVVPGSAAARAKPPFRLGDRIVKIDDVPIDNYGQIARELARKADKTITVVVERAVLDSSGKPTGRMERVRIPVEPNPMRRLGLVMKMGKIVAVQAGSPAALAGIQPGDMLVKPGGDPLTLPDRLAKMAGETVEITLQRETAKTPIETTARLREPYAYYPPTDVNNPVAVPALGIAYQVLNRVDSVIEGSPAAEAGLRPGDVIVKAKILPPETAEKKTDYDKPDSASMKFDEDNRNWPALMRVLQDISPDCRVELTYTRGEKTEKAVFGLVEASDWFNPDRGFVFEPLTFLRKAHSFGEALALGGVETLDAVTIVYRTLQKVGQNEVSLRLFAGPLTIAKVAGQKADQGTASLLLFLTLLSANLAVINFLPIPVLDGGHFVFLCYEGITGRPANERVQVALSYIGLALIIVLMIWVFGLDLHIFSRR